MTGYRGNDRKTMGVDDAEEYITQHTAGDRVDVTYEGPGGVHEHTEVSPEEAVELLRTSLKFDADVTPDERTRLDDKISGFERRNELYDGYGPDGLETPLTLDEDGEEYRIVADLYNWRVREDDDEHLSARLTISAERG